MFLWQRVHIYIYTYLHTYLPTYIDTYIHTSARTLVPIWLYTHRLQIYRYRHKGWNMRMQCYPHVTVGPCRCQDKVELRGRRLVDRNIETGVRCWWGTCSDTWFGSMFGNILLYIFARYLSWRGTKNGKIWSQTGIEQGPSETVGSKVDGKCQYNIIISLPIGFVDLLSPCAQVYQRFGSRWAEHLVWTCNMGSMRGFGGVMPKLTLVTFGSSPHMPSF